MFHKSQNVEKPSRSFFGEQKTTFNFSWNQNSKAGLVPGRFQVSQPSSRPYHSLLAELPRLSVGGRRVRSTKSGLWRLSRFTEESVTN